MAYCPKCGVEVDNVIRECPLCRFPIPDITEPNIRIESYQKYPEVTNIYKEYLSGIKNQVFFVVSVLLISIILILVVIQNVFHVDSVFIDYFYVAAIACGAYVYFGLGFHSWPVNITGMAGTTALFTYIIETIQRGGWYWSYAFPIVLGVCLNAL